MHDTLIIHVPLNPVFVRATSAFDFTIVGDLHWYGLPTCGGVRYDDETGETQFYDLKCPFESLPSSFDGMAIKFYHQTTNCIPYLALNASPKFIQGHNIYGAECVEQLAFEMLGTLRVCYPKFYALLDIKNADISRVDITYSTRLTHDDLVLPVIDMIGKLSVGQRKPDVHRNKYLDTRYWGVSKNRVGYCKLYGKNNEVASQIKSLKRKAIRGNTYAKRLIDNVFNSKLENYAKNLLRFEATNKRDMLKKLSLPTNLWQFINHQKKYPDVNLTLWNYWFDCLLQAMQGEIMTNIDDSEVLELCKSKLYTINSKGQKSFTIANNTYRFYVFVKEKGFLHAKHVTNDRTFYRNIKLLCDIGIPKSHLQNLNGITTKSVALVELVKFDFSNQAPVDYVLPVSSFSGEFDEFLQANLLVA